MRQLGGVTEGTGLRQREGGLPENLEIAAGEAAGKVLHFCLVEEKARGTHTFSESSDHLHVPPIVQT